jgi:hypothetical protein
MPQKSAHGIMKVTAFHLAGKVEEAARSYFSNSFVFSSRTIDVERTFDFRKGSAALQFYLHDGDERVPMGGMEFVTIQDRDNKIALQCRTSVLPAERNQQLFMILPSDVEQYSQYTRLAGILGKEWEKDVDAYLPKNETTPLPAAPEAPPTVDDEYASLTPEEIEAITGVKPSAPATPAPKAASQSSAGPAAGDDDVQRLVDMMSAGAHTEAEAPAPLSMEEIEALARQGQEPEAPANKDEGPLEMNVEDIWKQINGGK